MRSIGQMVKTRSNHHCNLLDCHPPSFYHRQGPASRPSIRNRLLPIREHCPERTTAALRRFLAALASPRSLRPAGLGGWLMMTSRQLLGLPSPSDTCDRGLACWRPTLQKVGTSVHLVGRSHPSTNHFQPFQLRRVWPNVPGFPAGVFLPRRPSDPRNRTPDIIRVGPNLGVRPITGKHQKQFTETWWLLLG